VLAGLGADVSWEWWPHIRQEEREFKTSPAARKDPVSKTKYESKGWEHGLSGGVLA
jgi:hypothetical protein